MDSDWCLWSVPFQEGYAIGRRARDVTSQLSAFVSHRSSAFLRVVLMILVTQLTVGLQAGSLVSLHNFLSLFCVLIVGVSGVERYLSPKKCEC